MSEYEEILAELKRLREEIADLRRAEYVARAGDADLLQGLAPDATGAADAHVVATDASGNARIGGGLRVGGLRMPMVSQTISGGAITVGPEDGYIRIDTEGAAPTDDLDTINGGSDGQIIVLRTRTTSRSVVVKNNTGNITCGADVILSHPRDKLMLIYDATTPIWTPIAPPANNA